MRLQMKGLRRTASPCPRALRKPMPVSSYHNLVFFFAFPNPDPRLSSCPFSSPPPTFLKPASAVLTTWKRRRMTCSPCCTAAASAPSATCRNGCRESLLLRACLLPQTVLPWQSDPGRMPAMSPSPELAAISATNSTPLLIPVSGIALKSHSRTSHRKVAPSRIRFTALEVPLP